MKKVPLKAMIATVLSAVILVASVPVSVNAGMLTINQDINSKKETLIYPTQPSEESMKNTKITYNDISEDQTIEFLQEQGIVATDTTMLSKDRIDLSQSEFFPSNDEIIS